MEPTSSTSVLSVRYGTRAVKKSDVFHDYASYGLPDGELQMDYNFWIIRSGGSVILVDTGYDIEAHDWLGEISVTPTPVALEKVGIDPLEVDMVIMSHFHYDHVGFVHLFTNAQLVCARAEYDFWFGKRAATGLDGEFATEADLAAIAQAETEGRLRLVDAATEVFPGVTVHPVGGHCPGQLIVHVASPGGAGVILTADAAHLYDQIEHEWPFFAFTDLEDMRRGLAFINQLARETGASVVPGHDARTRERYSAAPDTAGEVATVLM